MINPQHESVECEWQMKRMMALLQLDHTDVMLQVSTSYMRMFARFKLSNKTIGHVVVTSEQREDRTVIDEITTNFQ
jgi:hypothetical protein